MIALTVAIAACEDNIGPINNEVIPGTVSGLWTYSASNVTASGVTCNLSGVSISMTQSGDTVAGSLSGGTSSCTFPGGISSSTALVGLAIVNGTISGKTVTFDIGTPDIHNVGTLSGNSMSGTVTIHVTVGGSSVVLTGPFSATRQ